MTKGEFKQFENRLVESAWEKSFTVIRDISRFQVLPIKSRDECKSHCKKPTYMGRASDFQRVRRQGILIIFAGIESQGLILLNHSRKLNWRSILRPVHQAQKNQGPVAKRGETTVVIFNMPQLPVRILYLLQKSALPFLRGNN